MRECDVCSVSFESHQRKQEDTIEPDTNSAEDIFLSIVSSVSLGMNVITINNLAAQICETDLTQLFTPFGGIIRIKLTRKHDQKTRSIEGIAQVTFVSSESAISAARHMHGYMVMGRKIM
ncbi:RNA-binding protein [archaeon]|nr:MAG: RNA-binding protein [archaeon]